MALIVFWDWELVGGACSGEVVGSAVQWDLYRLPDGDCEWTSVVWCGA